MDEVRFHCHAAGTVQELLPDAPHYAGSLEQDEFYFDQLMNSKRQQDLIGKACKLSTDNHADFILPLLHRNSGESEPQLYALIFSIRANKDQTSWKNHWDGFLCTGRQISYLHNYRSIDLKFLKTKPEELEAEVERRFELAIKSAKWEEARSREKKKLELNRKMRTIFSGAGRILIHLDQIPRTSNTDENKEQRDAWDAVLGPEEFSAIVSSSNLETLMRSSRTREIFREYVLSRQCT